MVGDGDEVGDGRVEGERVDGVGEPVEMPGKKSGMARVG